MPVPERRTALPPDQLADAIRTAYQGARAVHLKGSLTDEGKPVALDLQLNRDSAAGTVTEDATTVPVLLVDGVYHFPFTDSVMKAGGVSPTSAAGRQLRGKWVPSTSSLAAGMVTDLQDTLSYDKFLGGIADEVAAAPPTRPAQRTTVNGVPALAFVDTDGGSLDVDAAEPHRLLRLAGPPSDPGTVDFTGWDQPVPVTKPAASAIYTG